MATLLQQSPYRCDQCGTTDVVAASLVYQQGTRMHLGMFNSGSSQSHSAQIASPPQPRGYARPLFLWGFAIYFACFWAYAGLSALHKHPNNSASFEYPIALLLFLGLVCLGVLIIKLRRISHYNREVYPKQRWDWEHTYMCRRCGSRLLISS
jgi:hypothetical protein